MSREPPPAASVGAPGSPSAAATTSAKTLVGTPPRNSVGTSRASMDASNARRRVSSGSDFKRFHEASNSAHVRGVARGLSKPRRVFAGAFAPSFLVFDAAAEGGPAASRSSPSFGGGGLEYRV